MWENGGEYCPKIFLNETKKCDLAGFFLPRLRKSQTRNSIKIGHLRREDPLTWDPLLCGPALRGRGQRPRHAAQAQAINNHPLGVGRGGAEAVPGKRGGQAHPSRPGSTAYVFCFVFGLRHSFGHCISEGFKPLFVVLRVRLELVGKGFAQLAPPFSKERK